MTSRLKSLIYDKSLYQLINDDKDWDGALECLWTDEGKEEAKIPDWKGELLLDCACQYKPPLEVVEALLEAHPEAANIANDYGMLPLHTACSRDASAEVVKALLKANPDGIKTEDEKGKLPLHNVCEEGARLEVIQSILEEHREGITTQDKEGKLPLHVVHGNTPDEVVEALVQAYREKVRRTLPKAYEAERGNYHSFAKHYNHLGFSSATRSVNRFEYQKLPLQHALKSGAPLKVILKLLEVYPNGGFYGDELRRLPLHYAFLYRATRDVAEAVLKSCRDAISQVDVERRLPLHYACREGIAPDVLGELLAAYPGCISKADNDGRLPIHHACDKNPQDETIKLLTSKHPKGAVFPDSKGDLPTHLLVSNEGQNCTQQEILLTSMMTDKGACNSIGSQGVVLPLHIAAKCNVGFEIFDQLLCTYPEAASRFQVNPPRGNRLALDILEEQRGAVPKDIWTDPFNLKSDLLFSCNPNISPWKDEPERLLRLEQRIMNEMEGKCRTLSKVSRRVWVWMCESDLTTSVANILEQLDKKACTTLASIKTRTGQRLLVGASPECGRIIRSCLLFVGRYHIAKNERPLHQSATCLVLRARDFGSLTGAAAAPQESSDLITTDASVPVVIKFMFQKDQFEREKSAREDLGLTPPKSSQKKTEKIDGESSESGDVKRGRSAAATAGIADAAAGTSATTAGIAAATSPTEKGEDQTVPPLVPFVAEYDANLIAGDKDRHNQRFKKDRDELADSGDGSLKLNTYDYALVMPEADRTLDSIYRHERPSTNEVRLVMNDLARALEQLHIRGIIHGDLKLLNVVRMKGRISLIDMDASCRMEKRADYDEMCNFAGAKFSSGVLPPEMIASLDEEGKLAFKQYWKSAISTEAHSWMKIKQSETFVVKTFIGTAKGLPYEPVRASTKIDMWSFGALLLQLSCGEPLFPVNRDDDLVAADDFRSLYNWDKSIFQKLVSERIEDLLLKDLLENLLVDEGSRLATFTEVLEHPFFKSVDDKLEAHKKLILLKGQVDKQAAEDKDRFDEAWEMLSSEEGTKETLQMFSALAKKYNQRPLQPKWISSLHDLMDDAKACQEDMHKAMRAIVKEAGGEFDKGPLKKKDRIEFKTEHDYKGDYKFVVDVVRATAVFDSLSQTRKILELLSDSSCLSLIRCKDRFNNPLSGYRDILLNVVQKGSGTSEHVAELQVHLKPLKDIKAINHRVYELQRVAGWV